MAKTVEIDIVVNGKMQKATVSAKKLQKALDGVDTSQEKTTKGTDDFQRGLKGVGEQSANASKNFSKFSQGMGGFVGVYASLAAQLFAVSAAFNFLKRAGDLEALKQGQIAYASSTGTALRTLATDIQTATNAQVSFQDASQAAAIGTAAGLSADQLRQLGSAAADASQILGRDVTDSFNRLVRGVTKAEPELLDELGIILRLKDATKAYADEIGKTPDQLTQFEKSQAVANDVLGQAQEKYSAILEVVGRTPNEFGQLGVAFDEITNDIKSLVSAVAGPLATALKETPLIAYSAFGLLLSGPMKAMGFSLKDIAKEAAESAELQKKKIDELKIKRLEMVDVVGTQTKKIRDLAKEEVKAGTKSKILQNLAQGGKLYGADKANLKKALKSAENQLRTHGVITTGIFAGRDAAVVAGFRDALTKMDNAVDESASKYALAMNYMKTQTAGFVAFAKNAFAGLMKWVGRIFSIAGWASIIALAYQSSIAAMKKYGLIAEEVAPDFDVQAEAATVLQERIKGLTEEYEKFAEVLSIKLQYASGSFDVLYTNAGELANMLSTMFSRGNTEAILTGIVGPLTAGFENIRATQDEVNKRFEEMQTVGNRTSKALTASIVAFGAELVTIGDADAGSVFNNVVAGMDWVQKAMIKLGMQAQNFAGQTNFQFNLDENLLSLTDAVDQGIQSIEVFQAEMESLGLVGYQAFDDMGSALKDLKKLSKDGIENEEEMQEVLRLKQKLYGFKEGEEVFNFETGQFEVAKEGVEGVIDATARLAGNLKLLPEQAKATAQAFGTIDAQLKGSGSGDALRNAAAAQLTTLNAIIKARGEGYKLTEEETELIAKLNAQEKLGETISKRDFKRKKDALELQLSSLRNYNKIESGTAAVLKKEDEIAKALNQQRYAQEDLDLLNETYNKEKGNLTPEIERQVAVLQAQVDLETERVRILEEEESFLKRIENIKNSQDVNKTTQQLLAGRKQLLDMAQKEFALRQQIADIDRKMARDRMSEAVADKQTGFFADDSRIQANANLQIAQQEAAIGKVANEQEYQNKLAQIGLEYELLDAKKEQTALEFELLAEQLKEKFGEGSSQALQAEQLAAKVRGHSYTQAQAAAEDLALKARDAANYGLDKAVRDAQRAVDALDAVQNVLQTAADSFTSSLNDAINAVFDSIWDETMDLKERLKEIGRGFLQSIQKAVTDKLIVQPILDMFFPDRGSSPSNPMWVAMAPGAGAAASATGAAAGTPVSTPTGILSTIIGGGQRGHSKDNPLYVCCVCAGEDSAPGVKDQIIDKVLKKKDPTQKEGAAEAAEQTTFFGKLKEGFMYAKNSFAQMFSNIFGEGGIVKNLFSKIFGEGGLLSGGLKGIGGFFSKIIGTKTKSETTMGIGIHPTTGLPIEETITTNTPGTGLIGMFENLFGEGGTISSMFGKLFGEGGMLKGMFGKLFGEGGLLKGMFGKLFGEGGMLKGMFGKLFGGEGGIGGMLSGLLGGGGGAAAAGGGGLLGGGGGGIMALLKPFLSMIPGIGPLLSFLPFKNGGIMDNGRKIPGYAAGGIANGPKDGHPAMLHGKEAVVPLPKGNAIPVDMKGAGGTQNNNVSVNVAVGANGNSQTSVSGGQGADLGAAVAQAVQKELQNQKRAGGILNPYGAT